jgi:4,5-DOPA dioxygenase extradiol
MELQMTKTPVLFLGHGSPMNAIEDNAWSRAWRGIGERLTKPKAILMVSAHWETRGVAVTAAEHPETIHDFGGFPQALFDVRYPAPGDPALSRRVAELLSPEPVGLDPQRGFDHGAWSVIRPMYPNAEVPMVQLSLDRTKSPQEHYELGKRLRPLRDEGVLIVGSGDIVHNLRAADFRRPSRVDWADRFNEQAKRLIEQGDHQPLIDYATLGDDAAQSINSAEHYLPLLYVLAAQERGERVSFFNDDVFAAISMTSLAVGAEELAA